jgi:sugar/nucleoside kinase (ribokinase family)
VNERGAPDFLVVGHVVEDLLPDGGWRPGGAACYAALLARNLGLRTAVLTACGEDFPVDRVLAGIEVCRVESKRTTQMRNVYDDGRRIQWCPQRATPLTAIDLAPAWRSSSIVLLGPVAGEVDDSLAAAFGPETLVGAGAQGWLRVAGPDSRISPVMPSDWDAVGLLSHIGALFLSDEDLLLDQAPEALAEWASLVGILAFTRGSSGADLHAEGEWQRVDAFSAKPADLTGAGDTFAAAFLCRYRDTRDARESARYAAAAASLVIEGIGVAGVPDAAAVEERLRAESGV